MIKKAKQIVALCNTILYYQCDTLWMMITYHSGTVHNLANRIKKMAEIICGLVVGYVLGRLTLAISKRVWPE